jgi:serine/threonine protein kinase/Flp pilus assembly protein TadD
MVEMASAHDCSWLDIDPFVEAYERCQAERGQAVLAEFLPGPDHPHYQTILVELIRVDLEMHWSRGRRKRIEDYFQDYPHLRDDREAVSGIAYEEYRLRCRAGERPAPGEYRDRFGLDVAEWSRPHAPGSDPLRSLGTMLSSSAPGGARDSLELTALVWLHTTGCEARGGSPTRAVAELLTSADPGGRRVLEFQVIGELGRGAKSRVYLAQQHDLADRKVVLKVSSDILREPRLLAQLQHTHIVPIYSVHTTPPFQVFCMPYFGATTLADVGRALRQQKSLPRSGRWFVDLLVDRGGIDRAVAPGLRSLESMTYVESVLWLGERLAEGLEHAHQRGIVHGDIKPANILISDDGQPLLLDFNLAREIHRDGDVPEAYLGGTLPYMPPEQLDNLAEDACPATQQSDVYALGVVLCELLTGRLPYPLRTGTVAEVIAAMHGDRQGPLPPLQTWSPALTPAEASILRRCLAPDPAQRYASATQLREDLQRHRTQLPLAHAPEPSLRERLRKWARRHPYLTSVWAMLLLAAVAVGALLTVVRHVHRLEALEEFHAFHDDFLDCGFLTAGADLGPGIRQREMEKTRAALARYHLPDDDRWEHASIVSLLPAEDRARLRQDLGELLVLRARALRQEAQQRTSSEERDQLLHEALASNQRAESCSPEQSRRILTQRSVLLLQLGKEKEAADLLQKANEASGSLKADEYLLTWGEMNPEQHARAVAHLEELVRDNPQDAVVWFRLAIYYGEMGRHDKALACYNASIALWPKSDLAFHGRSLAHLELGELPEALADCTRAIDLRPDYPAWYFNCALVRWKMADARGALKDLNVAVEKDIPEVRAWFLRARVREKLGDVAGAKRDRDEGLRRRPTDPESWAERGVERMKSDRKAALADIDEALRRDPRCRLALLAKSQIVSEDRGRPEQERTEAAIKVLDEAVKHHPLAADFRAGRGVLLARLGKHEAALADAREALRLDRGPAIRYQVAGIYFLTAARSPEHRLVALTLLGQSLLEGYGFELLAIDPELASVRGSKEFDRLVEAIRKVRTEGPRK